MEATTSRFGFERLRAKLLTPAVYWVKVYVGALARSRTFGVASELTFWLFLSLLPLAAVVAMVAAKLAMRDEGTLNQMLGSLPFATQTLLHDELGKVSAWNGGRVAPLAAIIFVWLASSGVHSIFDALEIATGTPERAWWKKRLRAIAMCVGLSIGGVALALLGIGLDWVHRLSGSQAAFGALHFVAMLSAPFRVVLGLVIAVALVTALYWVGLPKCTRRRMPMLPGAIAAVLAHAVMALGYGFYVSKAGDGGAYQAGLAVIGVTMMALYLFSVALLAGVELNQLLGLRRTLNHSLHLPAVQPPAVTYDMVKCDDERAQKRARVRARRSRERSSGRVARDPLTQR